MDFVVFLLPESFSGEEACCAKTIEEITRIRKSIDNHENSVRLAVKGEISMSNVATLARSGADMFVVGRSVFDGDDYYATISNFKKRIAQGYAQVEN